MGRRIDTKLVTDAIMEWEDSLHGKVAWHQLVTPWLIPITMDAFETLDPLVDLYVAMEEPDAAEAIHEVRNHLVDHVKHADAEDVRFYADLLSLCVGRR